MSRAPTVAQRHGQPRAIPCAGAEDRPLAAVFRVSAAYADCLGGARPFAVTSRT